jgi:formate-dependent nitrite reductase membrane component NrfD
MTTIPQPLVPRAPYGRHSRPAAGSRTESGLRSYDGPTYYGLPALKSSHYGKLVAGYLFVGGLAGSSQVLATVADLAGRDRYPHVVRAGRYLALAGAAVSPLLLIGDLHRPGRWYNMLRVFRPTSAMSIGSWTLSAFGTLSGLTAAGQVCIDLSRGRRGRKLARLFGVPAAAAGAMMSVYTGSLLACTSTPLWASVPRLLPALFGASAASTAAAAVSVALEAGGSTAEERDAVGKFSLVAGAAELALATAARRSWEKDGLDTPLKREPEASKLNLGVLAAGVALPLAVHGLQALTGRRSRAGTLLAAGAALVGGLLLRSVVLNPGNASARRAEDYFQFTRPGSVGPGKAR